MFITIYFGYIFLIFHPQVKVFGVSLYGAQEAKVDNVADDCQRHSQKLN